MNSLPFIIEQEMLKHQVRDYHVKPLLFSIAPGSTVQVEANNDFSLFVHAFAESSSPSGRISGNGQSIDVKPITLLTRLFKHKVFKGNFSIENHDTRNTLYVEMLRVNPVSHH